MSLSTEVFSSIYSMWKFPILPCDSTPHSSIIFKAMKVDFYRIKPTSTATAFFKKVFIGQEPMTQVQGGEFWNWKSGKEKSAAVGLGMPLEIQTPSSPPTHTHKKHCFMALSPKNWRKSGCIWNTGCRKKILGRAQLHHNFIWKHWKGMLQFSIYGKDKAPYGNILCFIRSLIQSVEYSYIWDWKLV